MPSASIDSRKILRRPVERGERGAAGEVGGLLGAGRRGRAPARRRPGARERGRARSGGREQDAGARAPARGVPDQ